MPEETARPTIPIKGLKLLLVKSLELPKSSKLTPQERLKLCMNRALNRQLKADKKAAQEKMQQQEHERQEREDELRAMARKIRMKERERREKERDEWERQYSRQSRSPSRSPKHSSAHRYHPCADSGGAKMNTRCPPKRVPSAARFFTLCRLTVQPPQSYSVRGQRSSGQLTGKPAGPLPDYTGSGAW
ncbi:UNVERIFIED_CONTAM: hypothetical protein FKN15_042713 [Acipenser sinensis]